MSGRIALDTDVSIKFLNGDTNIEAVLLKYSEICYRLQSGHRNGLSPMHWKAFIRCGFRSKLNEASRRPKSKNQKPVSHEDTEARRMMKDDSGFSFL